jgi:hypothetical protein
MFTVARAICLAQLGDLDEARTLVRTVLDDIEPGDVDDETPMQLLAILLRAAVLLEHRPAARALAERLACVAHVAVDVQLYTSIGHHLGDAAALAGDREAARAYYVQAVEAAGKIRWGPPGTGVDAPPTCRPVAGGLGRPVAAIPELRDMHMQPALERALALSGNLVAGPTPAFARAPAAEG